jgi:hypothetical protein
MTRFPRSDSTVAAVLATKGCSDNQETVHGLARFLEPFVPLGALHKTPYTQRHLACQSCAAVHRLIPEIQHYLHLLHVKIPRSWGSTTGGDHVSTKSRGQWWHGRAMFLQARRRGHEGQRCRAAGFALWDCSDCKREATVTIKMGCLIGMTAARRSHSRAKMPALDFSGKVHFCVHAT